MNSAAAPSDTTPSEETAPSDETSPGSIDSATTETVGSDTVDLDAVHRDLDGVEAALARLDAGTYWSDEVTGASLPDDLLAADPTARRAVD